MQLPKTSEIDRLAWGTDAGFYRLLPKHVVHPNNEQEIIEILDYARKNKQSITSALPEQVFRDKPLPTPF